MVLRDAYLRAESNLLFRTPLVKGAAFSGLRPMNEIFGRDSLGIGAFHRHVVDV
jgi:hypothetical protein